jgi:hypothetical protein
MNTMMMLYIQKMIDDSLSDKERNEHNTRSSVLFATTASSHQTNALRKGKVRPWKTFCKLGFSRSRRKIQNKHKRNVGSTAPHKKENKIIPGRLALQSPWLQSWDGLSNITYFPSKYAHLKGLREEETRKAYIATKKNVQIETILSKMKLLKKWCVFTFGGDRNLWIKEIKMRRAARIKGDDIFA